MSESAKRILIVDDDKEMTLLMQAILKKHHYEVYLAHDGLKAIKKSNEHSIDLILMDIRMPFFSGFWFCDAFKQRPGTKNIPILIVSSLSDEATIKKAYQMGASGYLKKPFEAEELLTAVKKVLS